jgi:hypothetical protein
MSNILCDAPYTLKMAMGVRMSPLEHNRQRNDGLISLIVQDLLGVENSPEQKDWSEQQTGEICDLFLDKNGNRYRKRTIGREPDREQPLTLNNAPSKSLCSNHSCNPFHQEHIEGHVDQHKSDHAPNRGKTKMLS